MTTFEEKSNPYEILIRFDETTGALKGAHQQRINVVLKDGVVIQATLGDAVPLDLTDFAGSELMSEATEGALQANAALAAENEALINELEQARNGVAAAEATILRLNEAMVSLRADLSLAYSSKPAT